MALWQSSFADKEQQQCATRFLKSWGDDLCPTCMGELSFDHRCDTNDIAIAKHTQTVRDVLRTTPLLDTIRSAHEYQRESTEKPAPIMGPDFFLDARGQDGSDNESASADTESQRSSSEDEDSNEEQDHSEFSGDDSSLPPSPSDDEREDWE